MAALVGAVLTAACGPVFRTVVATPSEGQTLRIVEGAQCLASRTLHSEVTICPEAGQVDAGGRQVFRVQIRNNGPSGVVVSSDQVTVVDAAGSPVHVIGTSELEREAYQQAHNIRSEAQAKQVYDILSALGGASSGDTGSGDSGQSEPVVTPEPPEMSTRTQSSGSSQPSGAEVLSSQRNLAEADQLADEVVRRARSNAFPAHTIDPGVEHRAAFTTESVPRVEALSITIVIGDERHIIAYRYTPAD